MLKYQAVAVQKVNNQVVINGFFKLLGDDFVEFRLVDRVSFFGYFIHYTIDCSMEMKQDQDGIGPSRL